MVTDRVDRLLARHEDQFFDRKNARIEPRERVGRTRGTYYHTGGIAYPLPGET